MSGDIFSTITHKRLTPALLAEASRTKEYLAVGEEVARRNGDDFEPSEFISWLAKGMANCSLNAVEIRKKSGELQGLVVYSINTVDSKGTLDLVWTAPAMRRHGVGRHMVDIAFSEMQKAGVAVAHLWVGNDNSAAQRAYESMGWNMDGADSPTHRHYVHPTNAFLRPGR